MNYFQVFNSIKRKELFRFLVGGGSAILTDYSIYRLLVHSNIELTISKILSFICGAAVGFVINKLWTFESKYFSKREVARYILLYFISAIVNSAINISILIITNWIFFAFLCATGVSTIMNFLGQKFFVFIRKGE